MKRIKEIDMNTVENWDKYYTQEQLQAHFERQDTFDLLSYMMGYIGKHDTILDVATGSGRITRVLIESGGLSPDNISVTDFCENSVKFVKDKFRGLKEAFVSNIYNIEKDVASYDIVIACEILEHLTEPKIALEGLIKLAKKRVIVSVPNKNSIDTEYHIWSFDENGLHSLLSFGYRVKVIETLDKKHLVGIIDIGD
ncbi:MAG: class I SAM-dependent methyltransferase [bacterium]|nr:class I SAM-dependent methyltransferase [bacterium]